MEARMVRAEEAIKGLAPVVMVRDMIEPLQRDVQKIAHSVQQLTESDIELKQMHKALMVDRARQEEERHKLEIQSLQEDLEEARLARADSEKKRGTIVFITQKAQPITSFIIALGVIAGLVYGFILWFQQHFK
jgi:hypothetical protein